MKTSLSGCRKGSLAAAALAVVLTVGAPAPLAAQEYPSRPVKFLIPYLPGSTLDAVVRIVSRHFQERTRQPAVVEYKPGAGAVVGAQAVLNDPRDGHTVFTPGPTVATWKIFNKEATVDLKREFIPVTSFYSVSYMVVTNSEVPVRTLGEFMALAKASPRKLNYGTSGGAMMLNMERLSRLAGAELVQVPYKAGADMKVGLMNNQVQLVLDNDAFHIAQSRAGKERILAVTGRQRIANIPDVPTVEEAGVRGYTAGSWTGAFVAAGTPDATVRRIYALLREAIDSTEYRDLLQKVGIGNVAGGQPPTEWAKELDTEMRAYEETAGRLGFVSN